MAASSTTASTGTRWHRHWGTCRSASWTHRRTTMTSPASGAPILPDYVPIPRASFGPAVNDQGYYVGRVERNLYWVTDGDYHSGVPDYPGRRRAVRRAPVHRPQPAAGRERYRRRRGRDQHGDPPGLHAPPLRPRRRVLAVRQRRGPHRTRGVPTASAAGQ